MSDFDEAAMEKWVIDHGSPRLQKARAAGLLSVSRGVYRSERLEAERPGWRFVEPGKGLKVNQICNPHEDALDALLDAREEWPEVHLVWLQPKGEPGEAWLMDTFLGRAVGIPVALYFEDEGPG